MSRILSPLLPELAQFKKEKPLKIRKGLKRSGKKNEAVATNSQDCQATFLASGDRSL
jgi:hypothetical protein